MWGTQRDKLKERLCLPNAPEVRPIMYVLTDAEMKALLLFCGLIWLFFIFLFTRDPDEDVH